MADDPSRIFSQIEQAAGFYGPVTYAQLLTRLGTYDGGYSLNAEQSDFIPVSAVNVKRDKERIPFIIGIIPPAADVTGRLLDRSASVLSVNGQEEGAAASGQGTVASTEGDQVASSSSPNSGPIAPSGPGRSAGTHKANRQTVKDAFTEEMGRAPTLFELQYAQAIAFLETGYGQGWKGEMKGSNNWGAVQCTKKQEAAGTPCLGYEDSYPDGTRYKQTFRAYATPKDGAKDMIRYIFKSGQAGQGLTESGSIYEASYIMRRNKYYGGFCPKATKKYGAKDTQIASFTDPDRNEATKACAAECVLHHAEIAFGYINDIALANGDATILGLGSYEEADAWWQSKFGSGATAAGSPVKADATAGDWAGDGAKNAAKAAKEQGKLGGTPLNSTQVGKAFQAAQMAQIKATQRALEKMAKVPPLKMLVNPAKFSVKGSKVIQDGNQSRSGHIIEHWGDGQDKISASGKLAGFYAIDMTNASGPGLTRMARNYSESWANFTSLYQIYRSNGKLILEDPLTEGMSQNISHVGSVYIYYDSTLYIGSFDSLNITESDTSPFTIEYSFEFTVRASFLLDRPDLSPGTVPTLQTSQDLFSTPE